MFEKLQIFRAAHGLAVHSAERQSVIAANIANADTPGYRALDVQPFGKVLSELEHSGRLRTTRPGHLAPTPDGMTDAAPRPRDAPQSPNGNSVSLETEMIMSGQARSRHEIALSIYSTSLDILRTSLGRAR